MTLIAIDMARKAGIAFGDVSGVPNFRTEILGDGTSRQEVAFSQALNLTNTLIKRHRPKCIVLEKAIVAGPKGSQTRAQMALGFRGCIMGVCRLHGVPFHEIPVQTARKYFIGRGDYPGEVAKKMSLEQCKRLGWAAKNLDEADAAAVWACAREELFKIQTPMVGWAASGDGMNEGRKPISRRSTSA